MLCFLGLLAIAYMTNPVWAHHVGSCFVEWCQSFGKKEDK